MNFGSPGFLWPHSGGFSQNANPAGISAVALTALNAAGLRIAFLGRVFIYGRPSGTKTISAAGGGSISWRSGAVTLNNGSTNLDFGLQGVSTSAGPAAQPDGTFSTKMSYTSGGKPTASAWNTATMTSGSKSLTQGDMIAVVWDMTARGGTDSVVVNAQSAISTGTMPGALLFNVTWAATTSSLPNVVIAFDDGTLGTIEGSVPYTTATAETFATGTNPNERGIIFMVPADCYIDALWAYLSGADGSAGLTFGLYTNPSTGQASVTTVVQDPHQLGGTSSRFVLATLPTVQRLYASNEYGVTVLATGTSNVGMTSATVNAVNYFGLWPGGTTTLLPISNSTCLSKITRNGSSGNFTGNSTLTYLMGVRIVAPPLYANTLVNGTGLVQ